jgi:hypothetical protein
MFEYRVTTRRIDQHGSAAACKNVELTLDTDSTFHDLDQCAAAPIAINCPPHPRR